MYISYIFIPLGPGVKKNYELPYAIELTDLLPTATRVLGLKQSPWWRGRVIEEAFNTEAMYPVSKQGCHNTSGSSSVVLEKNISIIIILVILGSGRFQYRNQYY